ncbi:MAG: hypothetical protein LBS50_03730 [Prevotellaceae bacterium]|jgi:hypothetical protein|nr:hypothetical protein [Prevotellaceae bacterium]
MKATFSLAAVVLAGFIFFAACGTTSPSSNSSRPAASTVSPAYTTGQSFGTALMALYSSYKSTKKVDFKDPMTLLNVYMLANSATQIKQNINNKTFYADFAKGALLGSQQNVNSNNLSGILNALTTSGLDLAGLANAAQNQSVSTSTANNAANVLTGLFGLLGK